MSGRISAVRDTFPRAGRLVKGYDVEQVEAFLSRARAAYEDSGRGPAMTSWHVRTVGFDLVRGGYDVEAVDAALDRIEDEVGDVDPGQRPVHDGGVGGVALDDLDPGV